MNNYLWHLWRRKRRYRYRPQRSTRIANDAREISTTRADALTELSGVIEYLLRISFRISFSRKIVPTKLIIHNTEMAIPEISKLHSCLSHYI